MDLLQTQFAYSGTLRCSVQISQAPLLLFRTAAPLPKLAAQMLRVPQKPPTRNGQPNEPAQRFGLHVLPHTLVHRPQQLLVRLPVRTITGCFEDRPRPRTHNGGVFLGCRSYRRTSSETIPQTTLDRLCFNTIVKQNNCVFLIWSQPRFFAHTVR